MPNRYRKLIMSAGCLSRRPTGRGQSVPELALALPLLLILLCAAVDVGRLAYTAITLNDAARAGAIYGSQSMATASDISGIQCVAYRDGKDVTPLTGSPYTCTCPDGSTWQCGLTASANTSCECSDGSKVKCGDGACGNGAQIVYVTVSTQAQFTPLTKLLPIPSPMTVGATATRRVGSP